MESTVTLVNHGRGLQLSTSRITVLDLVPYLRSNCPYDEIRRWVPTLSPEEIEVVASYYREHKEELDAADDRERERRVEQTRLQRDRFPENTGTPEQRLERLRKRLHQLHPEVNGEGPSCGR